MRRGWRPRGWQLGLIVAAFLLLLVPAAGLGALYLRLLSGPIDAGYLVGPVERAINAEIAPLKTRVGGATIRYEDGGIRFRLEDVRVYDDGKALVALAPEAAVRLSGSALLRGTIAPSSIDLIGPALLLTYSSEEGLTIRASRDADAAGEEPAPAPGEAAGETVPAPERTFALVRAAAEALAAARSRSSASSYLSRLGLSQARLVFDNSGSRSTWLIPSFSVRLDHRQKRSAITADGEIHSPSGPVAIGLTVEQSDKTRILSVVASLKGLVPADFAASLPELGALSAFAMPITGDVRVDLGEGGDVLSADADLGLGAGPVHVASVDAEPFALQSGEISLHYSAEDGRLAIRPSSIRTAGSRATIEGVAVPRKAGPDLNLWDFRVVLKDAVLGEPAGGLGPQPVDEWTAKGSFVPQSGLIDIEHMRIAAGGGVLEVAAQVSASRGITCRATLASMPGDVFTRLWPAGLGPNARAWVAANIAGGRVVKGAFQVSLSPRDIEAIDRGVAFGADSIEAELETEGVVVTYIDGLPPLETARSRLRLEGTRLMVEVDGARSDLGGGRFLSLAKGRFDVPHILAEPAEAEASFDVEGDAASIMDFLDREPLGYMQEVGLKPGEVEGAGTGSFKLRLPLINALRFRDVALNGEASLRELSSRTAFGPFPLDGGTIDVKISPKTLEAKGPIILSGVSADLRFVRFLAPGSGKQPAARVTARLDAADREQLGLSVNHVLFGEIPVQVSIEKGAKGSRQIGVQANLTDAELVLENLAWRKPPGEQATLRFDVVDGAGGRTILDNFTVQGQGSDIAISGRVTIGPDRKPVAFEFPDFSMNLLTQMRISGTLDADNIWQVKALATTYDGRPFLRSLFSAGRITERMPDATKGVSDGIDIDAEIRTMVGHADTSLRDVRVRMSRRNGLLAGLEADGKLPAGKWVKVRMEGGSAVLKVGLEASGGAEKTGNLRANNFIVATSDAVVSEMLSKAEKRSSRQRVQTGDGQLTGYYFNQLRMRFSVGRGQLVLHDAQINGPALGATINGTVDFNRQTVDLAGDYFPFYTVNAVVQPVPIFGTIFAGESGEGVFGLSYKISGRLGSPNVQVNPLSALLPGQFRKIFSYDAPDGPIPEAPFADAEAPPALASSLPPMTGSETTDKGGEPSVGDAMPAMVAEPRNAATSNREASAPAATTKKKRKKAVETLDGWGSETKQR